MKRLKYLFVFAVLWMAGASAMWAVQKTVVVDGITWTLNYQSNYANPYCNIGLGQTQTTAIAEPTSPTELVIPASFNIDGVDCPVWYISEYAFSGIGNITKVTISEGIRKINYQAFKDCSLTELVIPSTITEIGTEAFKGCTQLTKVSMPEKMNGELLFNSRAFQNCTSLTTLYIGAGQQNGGEHTVIENAVFNNCSSLQEVHITVENPGRLYVREDAFEGIAQNCKFYVSQAFARAVEWGLTRTSSMTGIRKWGLSGLQTTDLVVEETAVGGKTLVRMPVKDDSGVEKGSYIAVVTFTSIDADNRTAVIYDSGIAYDADKIMTEGRTAFCGGSYSPHSGFYTWKGDGMNEGIGKMYLPEIVKDKNGNDFQIKGLGGYAFESCNNYTPQVTGLHIPRGYEFIADHALQGLALKGTFIVPSSIHALGNTIFPPQQNNVSYQKINDIYLLHTNPDDITWDRIYQGWELSRDVNLYVDNSIYTRIHTENGYPDESPFKKWEGEVRPYDASHYGLRFTNEQCLVDRTGALDNVVLENPLDIAPISWVNSTNTNVVSINNNGELEIGQTDGTAEVTLRFAGNDDFEALDLKATIVKRSAPDYTADQSVDNGLTALTTLKRLTPNVDEWMESEEDYCSRKINDNMLYFSASGEEGISGGYMLDTNPAVLSPTYGTLNEGIDPAFGFNAGGMLCLKVSGAGTLQVNGFTENDDAVIGIWTPGQEAEELYGEEFLTGHSYEVTSTTPTYVYIYGISLSELRPAFINSITWAPAGVKLTKLTIANTAINEEVDYTANGVTVTWQDHIPVITLNNANITYDKGPAIEINSYPEAYIYITGNNTISSTAENSAAISIGTMGGEDWETCGTVFIGADDNHDGGTLTIGNSTADGIYNYGSFITLDGFSGEIAGQQYGIHLYGETMDYYPENFYVKLGAGLELKLRGGVAAFKSEISWGPFVNEGKYMSDYEPAGDGPWLDSSEGSFLVGVEGIEGTEYVPATYIYFAPNYYTATTEDDARVKIKYAITHNQQGNRTVKTYGIRDEQTDYFNPVPAIPAEFEGNVIIPEKVTLKGKEYTVTGIGEFSFVGCSPQSVTIPSTVTELDNEALSQCDATQIICLATTPPVLGYNYEYNNDWTLYVPYGCLNRYTAIKENDENWADYFDDIRMLEKGETTVTTITPEDEFVTDYATDMMNGEEALDLEDAVACGVYYNLKNDYQQGIANGFDTEEGCVVINNTTSENDMSDIVNGDFDRAVLVEKEYCGLVVEVNGKGAVEILCQTLGAGQLTVRIGNGTPKSYTQNEQGTVVVMFDVSEPTPIYVYASEPASGVRSGRMNGMRRANSSLAGDNSVKIYQLRIVPPTDITISMNSLGIMTYASKYDLDFSEVEGLTAYFATGYDPETQKLTMEEQLFVGAEEGMMLRGEPGMEYTIPLTTTEPGSTDDNLLIGLIEATDVSQTERFNGRDFTTFILANGDDGINWYKLAEASYTLKPNSAYLKLPSDMAPQEASQANRLTMVFGHEETGISTATASMRQADSWYSIDGRQLQTKPVTKGIYVNNGRKVVIK